MASLERKFTEKRPGAATILDRIWEQTLPAVVMIDVKHPYVQRLVALAIDYSCCEFYLSVIKASLWVDWIKVDYHLWHNFPLATEMLCSCAKCVWLYVII